MGGASSANPANQRITLSTACRPCNAMLHLERTHVLAPQNTSQAFMHFCYFQGAPVLHVTQLGMATLSVPQIIDCRAHGTEVLNVVKRPRQTQTLEMKW